MVVVEGAKGSYRELVLLSGAGGGLRKLKEAVRSSRELKVAW